MDVILFIGAFIVILALIIGIPIAITYFAYKFLKKKYPRKPYRYLAFLPTVYLIFSIWTSIYPLEDFYRDDYKEVTKLEFPKDASFKYKSATFPDNFGDYTSVFMFETSETEFRNLENQLNKISFLEIKDDLRHSAETNIALQNTTSKIAKQYNYKIEGGKDFYVAMFDDNKTILVRRISW